MKRMLRRLILAGLVLGGLVPALGQASPVAWYEVGGSGVQYIDDSYWFEDSGYHYLNFSAPASADYRFTVSAVGKVDPYLSWGVVALNSTGSDLSFAFGVTTPITPISNDNMVYGSFGGSVTDATGDGQDVTPNQADTDGDGDAEIATSWLDGATNLGVDVGLGFHHPSGGQPGHSDSFGPYDSGPQAGPIGAWSTLGTIISFDLSGHNDVATLNGFASINPVPEPASLILLGSGLIGAAFLRMRRRRAQS